VSEAVVHELEVVDVCEEHCGGEVVTTSPSDRQLEELLEHRAVRQPGQPIVVCEERRLFLGRLQL
jgi:hypothetical protein